MRTRSTPTTKEAVDFSLFGGAEILPPSLSHLNKDSTSKSTSKSTTTSTIPSSSSSTSSEDESDSPIKYKKDSIPARAGDAWLPQKVEQDTSDFLWMMNEEPHRSRRRAILKAHPEVSTLLYWILSSLKWIRLDGS